MSDEKPRATLSDRQARGGVIGGKGYGFQAAYIVSRVPLWLADPDFVQFLQEGAGDVDVRFNRADGEERWYVQVKNHEVKMAEARKVLTQFRDTDAGSPGTYGRFTLACPGLHEDLKRLRAAVEELRGAAPFYRPGQDEILDNTWADLGGLVGKLDLPVDAAFLVDKVDFDTDLAGLTDDESLCNLFVGRLLRLDDWAWVAPDAAARVYEKLALLCHRALRQTCSREQVEAVIQEAVGELPVEVVQEGEPFKYACFISYRHGQRRLTERIVNDLYDALSSELELLCDEEVYLDRTRLQSDYVYDEALARRVCESACMVVVFTPTYFDKRHTYCAREYKAMERLEKHRLKLLSTPADKSRGLIIPIVFRGKTCLPSEIREQRQCYSFEDFLLCDVEMWRHPGYAAEIRRIAEYIADRCRVLNSLPEALGNCEEFRLPTDRQVRRWLDGVTGTKTPFPIR